MVNVEPEAIIWETESRQRELNGLYMDLLAYLKHVLRRVKHLELLLEQYKRRRLQFKAHLLEELTFFRTNDNMPEVTKPQQCVCWEGSLTYLMIVGRAEGTRGSALGRSDGTTSCHVQHPSPMHTNIRRPDRRRTT